MSGCGRFVLIDVERTRVSESVVFWRADGRGYTVNFDDAGWYTLDEARARVGDDRTRIVPACCIEPRTLQRVALLSKYGDAFERALAAAVPRREGGES